MSDAALRRQLVQLLTEGQAHVTFHQAVRDFPPSQAGIRPPGCPHSAWELVEHIRIALEDIARFSENSAAYVVLKFPDNYWPPTPAPPHPDDWKKSIDAIHAELSRFLKLVENPDRDLFQPFTWGDGQNLLREALLVADHNAYHVGQLMLLRRMLSA